MKVKFQADADLNEDIVTGVLRQIPEIDFQTAKEADLTGVPDENVLEIAALENRILVTHDRKTMPKHFAEFIQKQNCPGVLIISQKLEIKTAIDQLILVWAGSEAEEYINMIRELPI